MFSLFASFEIPAASPHAKSIQESTASSQNCTCKCHGHIRHLPSIVLWPWQHLMTFGWCQIQPTCSLSQPVCSDAVSKPIVLVLMISVMTASLPVTHSTFIEHGPPSEQQDYKLGKQMKISDCVYLVLHVTKELLNISVSSYSPQTEKDGVGCQVSFPSNI